MGIMQKAFQINRTDNVATALEQLQQGAAALIGECPVQTMTVTEEIPRGHKIALKEIKTGEDIIKYGVRIGRAGREIKAGEWVHLHNMHSVYDERSGHLDVHTGAPKDTRYE